MSDDHVAGRLVFYQKEGNATFVRDTGELASDVTTVAMFELTDPLSALRAVRFNYRWDFGNGQVIEGTEPVVMYNYTQSGNYTLRLHVDGNGTEPETPITGVYSVDVKVLDAIRNIQLTGPSNYQVSQNSILVFLVDGSPPMWVCWQILPDCVLARPLGCTLSMLYENQLRVEHTFTTAGVHCLDVSARNDVSNLQMSYSIYVSPNTYGNLLFILPCLAILMATFSFIIINACRPRRVYKPKLAASSNAMFLKEPGGFARVHLGNVATAERGEKERLLFQNGAFYSI
ncbi:transmembrane protein 130 [Lampris incognitus]|uniref:transmembrane protein 130 n=1 Tax=Lampris incognitus TaxID=2546036 RepID=UPI0024B4BC8C|nr:transmembrane protein 130 [Lampris incognitus]